MTIDDVTEFIQSGAAERLKSALLSLQRKYDYAASQTNQKSFFIGTADYVKAVCDSKILSLLLQTTVLNEKTHLFTEQKRLTKLVVEEIAETFEKLKKAIEKEKVQLPRVDEEIKEYASLVSGRTQSSLPIGQSLYGSVRDIIFELRQGGRADLVLPFAKNKADLENTEWEIAPSYKEYRENENEITRQKNLSVWGAWEELWWAYASVYKQKGIWSEWYEKKDSLSIMNGSLLFGGMNDILEGREPKSSHFDVETFKRHLSRFHDKFLDGGQEMLEVTKLQLTEDGKLSPEEGVSEDKGVDQPSTQFSYSRTGKGRNKSKSFRLTRGKPPFILFTEVYKSKSLSRKRVVKLLALDDDTRYRGTNTIKINEVIKQVRETTKLTPDELVNNGGEITLVLKTNL